jgi:adenylate kinase family enzyme
MFECIAWAHILDDKRKKLDAKSHACIMVGYSSKLKAYKLFDQMKQGVICKMDVVFYEKIPSIALLNSFGLLSSDPT